MSSVIPQRTGEEYWCERYNDLAEKWAGLFTRVESLVRTARCASNIDAVVHAPFLEDLRQEFNRQRALRGDNTIDAPRSISVEEDLTLSEIGRKEQQ